MTTMLHGRPVARQLQQQLLEQHQALPAPLSLGIVLVGDNPESLSYISRKQQLADKLGISVQFHQLPADATTADVCQLVDQLNADDFITGFIVQLPMPEHVDQAAVLARICPYKDVDGLNPWSLGKLVEGQPMLVSATARGVMELLKFYRIDLVGRRAVVVGRSVLVGKPTALLLLQADATVTMTHSRTQNLASICRQADLVIAAAGQPGLITAEHIHPQATIIDVGLTATPDGLHGDVAPDAAAKVAALSPVPGGVGPLTVTCLFQNLFAAHRLQQQAEDAGKVWRLPAAGLS